MTCDKERPRDRGVMNESSREVPDLAAGFALVADPSYTIREQTPAEAMHVITDQNMFK